MRNKTAYTAIILIIVVVVIVVAAMTLQQQPKIKIGVPTPLTGFLALAGEETRNGISLAAENLSATDVQLIYEDEECNSQKSLLVYRKLRDVDNVKYIIGPYCGQSAVPVLPLINEDKIIAISPGAPDNELAKPNDYFFRTQVPNSVETRTLAGFLISRNITNVTTFTALNTFGESYKNAFIKDFTALGGNVISSEGSQDYQSDFRTEITKLIAQNPQAVFLVPASRNQMGIFIKQSKELGFAGLVIGGSVTEEPTLFETAADAADGLVYVHYIDVDSLSPKQKAFFDKYKSRFGFEPTYRAYFAYDAFQIIYSAIKQCGEDVECSRNFLDNMESYDGVSGPITFDENGDAIIPLVLKTVKDGEFVKLESD